MHDVNIEQAGPARFGRRAYNRRSIANQTRSIPGSSEDRLHRASQHDEPLWTHKDSRSLTCGEYPFNDSPDLAVQHDVSGRPSPCYRRTMLANLPGHIICFARWASHHRLDFAHLPQRWFPVFHLRPRTSQGLISNACAICDRCRSMITSNRSMRLKVERDFRGMCTQHDGSLLYLPRVSRTALSMVATLIYPPIADQDVALLSGFTVSWPMACDLSR